MEFGVFRPWKVWQKSVLNVCTNPESLPEGAYDRVGGPVRTDIRGTVDVFVRISALETCILPVNTVEPSERAATTDGSTSIT